MTKKDYVAEILQKWYDAMEQEKVGVQPKCVTMLGTILAEYNISPNTDKKDIWSIALTIKGGEFPDWYSGLSDIEKREYEKGRQNASKKFDKRNKQLLKG
tara:strand:- start:502 stop:801 length:300 start_codon:yes stop_codon:yes gene_type:complete